MSGSVARRGGIIGVFVAGVTAAVLGFTSFAQACEFDEDLLVNVLASGAGMTSLSNCLSDAQDGVVETALSDCEESRSEDGSLNLEDVFVKIFESENPENLLFSGEADIAMMEGEATAVVDCLNGIVEGRDLAVVCGGLEAPMQFMGVYIEQLMTEMGGLEKVSSILKTSAFA
jgi:hypothetical protein